MGKCRANFSKFERLNGLVFTVVLSTHVIKMAYKTQHKEKQNKTEHEPTIIEKYLQKKKTLGQNGTVIYMFLSETGSAEVRPGSTWAKGWSKGCPFEKQENRKWHHKPIFYKSSALGASKNGPRERFCFFEHEKQ